MASKSFIILLIQVIFFNICHGQNKADKWSEFRGILMSKYDTDFADYSSKKKFTDCIIEKLNANYPNGDGSMSQFELNKLAQRYGAICANELNGQLHFNVSWSSPIGMNFKKMLMTSDIVKNIPESKKSDFCDCFVLKLKKKYPNGFTETIKPSIRDSIYYSCKKELK
jgi:hypothetical protein